MLWLYKNNTAARYLENGDFRIFTGEQPRYGMSESGSSYCLIRSFAGSNPAALAVVQKALPVIPGRAFFISLCCRGCYRHFKFQIQVSADLLKCYSYMGVFWCAETVNNYHCCTWMRPYVFFYSVL